MRWRCRAVTTPNHRWSASLDLALHLVWIQTTLVSGEKSKLWNEIASSYEVWFDMTAERETFFRAATESKFDRENPRFVALSKLLTLDLLRQSDRQELRGIASRIDVKSAGRLDTEQKYARLLRVCAMKDQPSDGHCPASTRVWTTSWRFSLA